MKPRLVTNTAPPAESAPATDPLDRLYERHAAQVKQWARSLAGPTADLEDLVHDIFVVALGKGWKDRGEAAVSTWLFRITHHVVRGKRRRAQLRHLLLGRNRDVMAPPSPHTPLQELERRERHVRLYQALDQLPDSYRTMLILYELEELAGEQVAELTGIPLGTVWVRLHRGRERLLQLLAKEAQP